MIKYKVRDFLCERTFRISFYISSKRDFWSELERKQIPFFWRKGLLHSLNNRYYLRTIESSVFDDHLIYQLR